MTSVQQDLLGFDRSKAVKFIFYFLVLGAQFQAGAEPVPTETECAQMSEAMHNQWRQSHLPDNAPIYVRILKRVTATEPGKSAVLMDSRYNPILDSSGKRVEVSRSVEQINASPHSPKGPTYYYQNRGFEESEVDSKGQYNRYSQNLGEVQIWVQGKDGKYTNPDFLKFPIMAMSGVLGPKMKQGDDQAPEGLYRIRSSSLKSVSEYTKGLDLGFPNEFDSANGRSGGLVEIHGSKNEYDRSMKRFDGNPKSAGCFSIGNRVCEFYGIASAALRGGQKEIPVAIYPFPMDDIDLKTVPSDLRQFWQQLKPIYDSFEKEHVPPAVAIDANGYHLQTQRNNTVQSSGAGAP